MRTMRGAAAALLASVSPLALAATVTIPFHDGTPESTMQGEFVLDLGVPLYGIGPTGDYLYYQNPNEGVIRFHVRGELSLELPIQVVVVVPMANGHVQDAVEIQTYTSELPNDWHMKLTFHKNDGSWLGTSVAQPTDYSLDFDEAYFEAFFTDEFTMVRGYTITRLVIGVPPNPVPVPGALVLFGSATAFGAIAAAVGRKRSV